MAVAIPPALAASAWALADAQFAFAGLQLAYNALQLFAYPLLIGFAAQIDGSARLAAVAGGMPYWGRRPARSSAARPRLLAVAAG